MLINNKELKKLTYVAYSIENIYKYNNSINEIKSNFKIENIFDCDDLEYLDYFLSKFQNDIDRSEDNKYLFILDYDIYSNKKFIVLFYVMRELNYYLIIKSQNINNLLKLKEFDAKHFI